MNVSTLGSVTGSMGLSYMDIIKLYMYPHYGLELCGVYFTSHVLLTGGY